LPVFGVHHGDTVACWLSNRPAFQIADVDPMQLGAIRVPARRFGLNHGRAQTQEIDDRSAMLRAG